MLPRHLPPAHCKTLVVAISGGVDSMVLLHWAQQFAAEFKLALKALHINHQLSPNANQWQQHVEQYCENAQITLQVVKVSVTNAGQGLEQAARQARYLAFEQNLHAGDVLVVGHHQQDQAETLMLRLLRGAGVNGLTAMAAMRPLGRAYLWRPLLSCSKPNLMAYAARYELSWVEDESNHNEQFRRNYIRKKIMPALEQIWPSAAQKMAEAASHASEAQQLLGEYAKADFQRLKAQPEKLGNSIALAPLQAFTWLRQKQVLRYWLNTLGMLAPSIAQLDELKKLIAASGDASPELVLGSKSLRRYAGKLFLIPRLPLVAKDLAIPLHAQCYLPDGSHLAVKGYSGELTIRFRQGGERAHPCNRNHSQTLKKLLQEYGVEPWLRDRIPLIYSGNTLVAVADYWQEYAATKDSHPLSLKSLSVEWVFPCSDSIQKKEAK